MSRKYKFHDNDKGYFISLATIYWIDLPTYRQAFREGKVRRFCYKRKIAVHTSEPGTGGFCYKRRGLEV